MEGAFCLQHLLSLGDGAPTQMTQIRLSQVPQVHLRSQILALSVWLYCVSPVVVNQRAATRIFLAPLVRPDHPLPADKRKGVPVPRSDGYMQVDANANASLSQQKT